MQNHFADLELEVRRHLVNPEVRRKVLDDLARKILLDLVEIRRNDLSMALSKEPFPPSFSLLFSEAMMKGVRNVIVDELGKHEKPKKPTKHQIDNQNWEEQVDPRILARLSTRARGVCRELGFLTLQDMRAASDVDYLLVSRCGKGTLHEIREFLARDGEPTAAEVKSDREVESALAKALLNPPSTT